MSGVTLERMTAKIFDDADSKEMVTQENTFPWLLTKILFANCPAWLIGGFHIMDPLFPKCVKHVVKHCGDIQKPANNAFVDEFVERAALPVGEPYKGDVDEAWDAALRPGLGDFFEPEMDPAENAPPPLADNN